MIYLVRHGEAAAAWGDAPDPGLSELGHKQAAAAAEHLRELGAMHAITSPMKRCRETAAAFERLMRVHARVEPRVSEIVTPDDIGDDRTAWLRGLMAGNWDQSQHDFTGWIDDAVAALSTLKSGTVVFTHFVAINAIVGRLEADPAVVVFKPGHCSITSIATGGANLTVQARGSEAATRIL